jgi:hypothetical protein
MTNLATLPKEDRERFWKTFDRIMRENDKEKVKFS